jgi:hypothetical protein
MQFPFMAIAALIKACTNMIYIINKKHKKECAVIKNLR